MDTNQSQPTTCVASSAPGCSASKSTAVVAAIQSLMAVVLSAAGSIGDETLAAALYWPWMTALGVFILERRNKKPNPSRQPPAAERPV